MTAPDRTPTFADIASFTRAARVSSLAASASGRVVATLRSIDEDGSALVSRLVDIEPAPTARGRHGAPGGAEDPEDSPLRATPLTSGPDSATLLAVGTRGEVYFTRRDPEEEKSGEAVWVLPPRGEARVVLRHRGGVDSLVATASRLLVSAELLPSATTPADSDEAVKARTDAKVTAVLHDRFPIRSWDHDLGPGRTALFTAPLPDLGALAPAPVELTEVPLPPAPVGVPQWDLAGVRATPDGRLAVVTMNARREIDEFLQVWVLDLEGGDAPRLLAAEAGIDLEAQVVSPDGTFAVLSREVPPLPGQVLAVDLLRVDLDGGSEPRMLTASWDGVPGSVAVDAGGSTWFTADRLGRGGIWRVEEDGTATLVTPDDEYAYSDPVFAGGWLWALRSSVAEAPRVVALDPQTREVLVAPALGADFELPGELTEIGARAQDGTALRAWLALPEGEGPHPLLVAAHGGPWGSWNDWTWRWNPWVFVARGYAVLLPDPGISLGYGQAMTARGHDAIGREPFTDILALADAAVARPDVDGDRQAFAGGSYGGYMANWVAGHTGTRFRCVVTHAGLWDVHTMGLTTDNGSWYRWMEEPVGEGPSQAQQWSPRDSAGDIHVPMLVIHGAQDHRVPFSQALELWQDLHRLCPDLDHRFLHFPDEGHWILGPGNSEVWYETFLAFLDEHVLGKPFERPALLG